MDPPFRLPLQGSNRNLSNCPILTVEIDRLPQATCNLVAQCIEEVVTLENRDASNRQQEEMMKMPEPLIQEELMERR